MKLEKKCLVTENISMGGEEHLLRPYVMCEQQNIISLSSLLPHERLPRSRWEEHRFLVAYQ